MRNSKHLVCTVVTLVIMFAFNYSLSQIPRFNSFSGATATVFLDFDGHFVKGTAWNWDGPIKARSPELRSSQITEIYNRVAEDFRIFNINITTDSLVFAKAPVNKRIRIIFTPTSEWYGEAAGVSFINSFSWGDDTPAWVFCRILENNSKFIAEAASHEIGHSLGLQHQSTYNRNCDLVAEYAEGKGNGEIAWAPIMGVGYYRNFTVWTVGPSIEGCSVVQNDISIISKGQNNIGFRSDDHGNNSKSATLLKLNNENFFIAGIINNAADKDYFKLSLPRRMRLAGSLLPHNVAANNAGADVDLSLILITASGDTIGQYNPGTLLDAAFDTVLAEGIYFLGIDGTGNENVSDYGSVGLYNLSGSLQNISAAPIVLLRGDIRNNLNVFNWSTTAGSVASTTYLEYSTDGRNFVTVANVPPSVNTFSHWVQGSRELYYRVKMVMPDETFEYSNVVSLTITSNPRIILAASIVRNTIQVTSAGEYSYRLVDLTGRILSKGRFNYGRNDVNLNNMNPGMLILEVFDSSTQSHFRIIKR